MQEASRDHWSRLKGSRRELEVVSTTGFISQTGAASTWMGGARHEIRAPRRSTESSHVYMYSLFLCCVVT